MKNKIQKNYDATDIREFIVHSNRIEGVNMEYAHDDAIKAWEYISGKDVLTVSDVLHVHEILMERFNPRIAGKFRDCDVFIGGKRKKFYSEDVLIQILENICDGINKSIYSGGREDDPKKYHIRFEDWHGFEDGNGRTGRLIYNWHRRQIGLPIHIIHEGEEQFDYYKWFQK